ncbi:hypothetical protein [Bdellovibrio sp. HCB-162]|uniref:hypothetical protein n=1 Tax=Bdellovibrio sp. HCB-162 TaxID=3394234 RepID=UPI0039BC5C26
MKRVFVFLMLILSFKAYAAEDSPKVTQPSSSQIIMSLLSTSHDESASTSHYCCITKKEGTYCDMGYYDNFGQPCKCTLGNNVSYGHVCRN